MINIGKKEVLISYISYGFKIISNLFVLPVILSSVSSKEYAIWAIFLSVGALASLFDFGLGNVLTRYTTYAYSGADSIPIEGLPSKNNDSTNFKLLFEIFFTSKKIYKKIALLVNLILIIMTIYIVWVTKGESDILQVILGWIIYSTGIALGFYFNYYNAFIKGLGKIYEIQEIGIINRLIYIILQIFFIKIGWSFVGLGLANLISILFLRIQLNKHLKKFIIDNYQYYNNVRKTFDINKNKNLTKAIKKNSNQVGSVMITNYLQGQGSLLILSIFLPLNITAQYSLTMQLLSILVSVSSIPFNTFLPQLVSMQVQHQYIKVKRIYILVTLIIFFTFLLGGSLMIFSGEFFLNLIDSNTRLLKVSLLILLTIHQFILTNHQRATSFISLSNEQPYVKSYILSSVISLVFCLIGFSLGMGIEGFIIINLVIQLLYNGWKWPMIAYKKINSNLNTVTKI